ncbi:MAG: hypothetical protein QOG43_2007 [Actinomycetota bacterium]|jgi:hypothetical protein|nr:hypothetical protein [Actinomycetota bacterium]
MNRTRLYVALLGAIFLSAVGVGVVIGKEDRPMTQVASSAPVTTTTVARTTTTHAPTPSTTAAPAPTTTAAPPTTAARPVTTVPVVTLPPTTQPPVTEPPTTQATTTTLPAYDPIKCAEINTQFDIQGQHDNPDRVPLLQAFHCPEFYWQ